MVMPRGDLDVHPSPSPASDFMGFMAEYLTHHVHDLEALCHGHPQLRHLSTALATACRALHRSAQPGDGGAGAGPPPGDTHLVPAPFRSLSIASVHGKRPHRPFSPPLQ